MVLCRKEFGTQLTVWSWPHAELRCADATHWSILGKDIEPIPAPDADEEVRGTIARQIENGTLRLRENQK